MTFCKNNFQLEQKTLSLTIFSRTFHFSLINNKLNPLINKLKGSQFVGLLLIIKNSKEKLGLRFSMMSLGKQKIESSISRNQAIKFLNAVFTESRVYIVLFWDHFFFIKLLLPLNYEINSTNHAKNMLAKHSSTKTFAKSFLC